MYGYSAHFPILQKIRALDNHTVTAHKKRGLKLCNIAHEYSVSGGINYESISVHSKCASAPYHVLVVSSALGYVLNDLTVKLLRAFETVCIALGISPHSEYFFEYRHL